MILAASLAAGDEQTSSFDYPLSLAVADSGTIYVADRNLPGIWKLENESLEILFRGSKAFRTPLSAIRCVALDSTGRIVVGDSATRDVYQLDDQGRPVSLTRAASSASTEPSAASEGATKSTKVDLGTIGIPMDIAVRQDGDLYVSDLEQHRIVKIPHGGGEPILFATVTAPRGLCWDKSDHLWVISGRRLMRIAPSGDKTVTVDEGAFAFPHSVAIADDGTAYVCDGYAQTIWMISTGGKAPQRLANGPPLANPVGMRLAGDVLYVADPRAQAIFRVTLDGKISAVQPLRGPEPPRGKSP